MCRKYAFQNRTEHIGHMLSEKQNTISTYLNYSNPLFSIAVLSQRQCFIRGFA